MLLDSTHFSMCSLILGPNLIIQYSQNSFDLKETGALCHLGNILCQMLNFSF